MNKGGPACLNQTISFPSHVFGLTSEKDRLQCRRCGLHALAAAVYKLHGMPLQTKHRCTDVPLAAFKHEDHGDGNEYRKCPECGQLWKKGTECWPEGLSAAVQANVVTRRFVNTLAGHSKFWNVTLRGRHLDFSWGRIGTTGEALSKDCTTEFRAERTMWKIVREKVGKGYMELTPAGVPFAPDDAYLASMENAAALKDAGQQAKVAVKAFNKFGQVSNAALASMAKAIKWGEPGVGAVFDPDGVGPDAAEAAAYVDQMMLGPSPAAAKPKQKREPEPTPIPVVERRGRKIRF